MMFTLKRVLKDIQFIILLAAILIISILAYRAGESIKTPPYGYACEATGDDAERLCKEFDDAGFVRCESSEALRKEIGEAHLDCGIIVDENFEYRIADRDLAGAVTLVTSPETLLPELCRLQTVSVVTAIYAPYVTYDAMEGNAEYSTIKDTYDEMLADGALFRFEIADSEGIVVVDHTRSRNLFKGSLAILILIASWIGCCRPAYRHACDMKKRLTFGGAVKKVMFPEVIIRTVMIALAAVLTCLIAEQTQMIPVTLVYTLIVTAAGIPAVMILPDSWLLIITVFVMILSLGLCPIFTDLAELMPMLGNIRKALIPYLMWEIVL
ncbi:MAG: hypothetical protein Q4E54_07835 [Lachnospiraceae bacterium]|nr:hypothetical protein [Lachnospiraceae bacterium]